MPFHNDALEDAYNNCTSLKGFIRENIKDIELANILCFEVDKIIDNLLTVNSDIFEDKMGEDL